VGELKPSGQPAKDQSGGAFLAGLFITMFAGGLVSLFLGVAGMFGPTDVPCGQAYGEGAVLLVIALLFAGLAWYSFFRNKSRTAGTGLLRGVAVGALVVVLVPWPCSYSMTTLGHVTSCKR
jgi:hypothetical protein